MTPEPTPRRCRRTPTVGKVAAVCEPTDQPRRRGPAGTTSPVAAGLLARPAPSPRACWHDQPRRRGPAGTTSPVGADLLARPAPTVNPRGGASRRDPRG